MTLNEEIQVFWQATFDDYKDTIAKRMNALGNKDYAEADLLLTRCTGLSYALDAITHITKIASRHEQSNG